MLGVLQDSFVPGNGKQLGFILCGRNPYAVRENFSHIHQTNKRLAEIPILVRWIVG